jgi:N-formylglutamate amidohydrolase
MEKIYEIKGSVDCPVLLSSPHSGIYVPPEIKKNGRFFFSTLPDTDWFVDQLYDFAPSLGIPLVSAYHSRYVVDLNRSANSEPLYRDDRLQTGVVPLQTFSGHQLYRQEPSAKEIERRLEEYYWPYYQKIENLLGQIKRCFGRAILLDCHSIKRKVKAISEADFGDLILGDNLGTTSASEISQAALSALKGYDFSVCHNNPFRGGHLIRYFGRPDEQIHALQLEMAQDLYLDENNQFDEDRALRVREVLKSLLNALLKVIL